MSDMAIRLNAALQGRYAVVRELGEGGMANVYLADDLKHQRKVALKVLKPELAAVVGAERFLAEIKVTANLQHPNILPLHDSGEADGFLFYVMPYVEGDTLHDRLEREHQLPVADAVRIATDVADALGYAHRQGVIHRDIKPANVLMLEGKPVISDFGIALAVGAAGGGRLTETGLSLGTPHYMSPEQATGDQNVGPQTDTYALGCVLYEMLVGEPPFTGPNAQAVLGQIITAEAVSATEKRASIPSNVDAAIRKALEKLPADRFTSAQAFVQALGDEHFRYGESAAAGTGRVAVGPWNRLTIGTTGLAAVLALALAWSLLRPDPPRPLTRQSVRISEDQYFHPARGDFDLSRDGSLFVYRGVGEREEAQLWLKPLDALVATPIRDTDGARRPAISPDNQEVAFYTTGGAIRVVSLEGGVSRTFTEVPISNGGIPRWSPDGDWLYYTDASGGLSRFMVSGDAGAEIVPQIVTEVDTVAGDLRHRFVDVLPGNHAVYEVQRTGNVSRIHSVDIETGVVKDLTPGRHPRYSATGHLLFQHATEVVLLAASFDLETLDLTSAPQRLAEDLMPIGSAIPGNFAVSQTGRLFYRIGSGSGRVVPTWVGRDGSEEAVDSALFAGAFAAPRVSPDGRKIAVQNTPEEGAVPQIWIYDVGQRTFSPLTAEGSNFRPFWSPDGVEVGFISDRDGERAVYSRPWDQSDPARLVRAGSGAPILEALWTPNERYLVYESRSPGSTANGGDLYYAAPDPDSTSVTILDTPSHEAVPAVSQNGDWLAYQSDDSGDPEVVVRPFPGPGGIYRVSLEGGHTPVWADDGREIVYLSADNSLMVARVRTEPDFEVESHVPFGARLAFSTSRNTRQFDISPTDQRVLVLRIEDRRADELIWVENWVEMLRELGEN